RSSISREPRAERMPQSVDVELASVLIDARNSGGQQDPFHHAVRVIRRARERFAARSQEDALAGSDVAAKKAAVRIVKASEIGDELRMQRDRSRARRLGGFAPEVKHRFLEIDVRPGQAPCLPDPEASF